MKRLHTPPATGPRGKAIKGIEALGPRRLILSPLDNIRNESDEAMQRVETFIEAWRKMR